MEVKIKNRGGLRVSNALMWVLAVLSGTALGIIGSFAVAVSAMSDYREMYKQWIGMDTEITSKEMQENLAWIENSPWVVNFADENAQSDLLGWLLLALVALVIVFCAALIVLCVQTGRLGRAADGSIQLNRFDRVWSEVLLVLGCGGAGGAVALAVPVTLQGRSGTYLYGLCGEGSLILAGLVDYLCAQQKLRGAGFTVAVPTSPEQAALLQDKGFAWAFALRCLPREVERNL